MTYSRLNKIITMNEIMIENNHIYSMDAANTVELGPTDYLWLLQICFYPQNAYLLNKKMTMDAANTVELFI